MKTAHAGLSISEADWNAAVKDITDSLDKFKVPDKEKTDVLNLLTTLKKDIVHP